MKRNFLWAAIIAVIVIVVGVTVGLQLWNGRPGVRVFASDLYADITGKGYVFADKTGTLENEAVLQADGRTDGDGIFRGTLSVSAFPISADGIISGDPILTDAGGGFYYVEYAPYCTHTETVPDTGRQYPYEHACDYTYTYCFYPEDQDFMAVLVHDSTRQVWYTVVMADNEEQAKERYQWFLANEPSLYD